LDSDDKLLGLVNTTALLASADDVPLSQIMKDATVTLSLGSTLRDASELFTRYHYRAIPAIDEQGKMRGIVPYRDVMELKHVDMG
jgi:Mg/Co/Ni transporter MgtE